MTTNRLTPVLLLLALAGPVHAQDVIGPGSMVQELESLADATYAVDSTTEQAAPARRQARPVNEGNGVVAGRNGS